MLCQRCHKNRASVRYAEVVDGKVNNLQLCRDCLARQRDDTETGFELSDPAPVLTNRSASRAPLIDPASTAGTCVACNTTLKSIVDTGRVGCSVCYETFPAELESLLEGMHVALTHRGKTPRVNDNRSRVRADLQNKRTLLKTALGLENYEDAAGLRDEIRALETGLGVSVGGDD